MSGAHGEAQDRRQPIVARAEAGEHDVGLLVPADIDISIAGNRWASIIARTQFPPMDPGEAMIVRADEAGDSGTPGVVPRQFGGEANKWKSGQATVVSLIWWKVLKASSSGAVVSKNDCCASPESRPARW